MEISKFHFELKDFIKHGDFQKTIDLLNEGKKEIGNPIQREKNEHFSA